MMTTAAQAKACVVDSLSNSAEHNAAMRQTGN
jgi:hypothetical protein